MRHRQRYTAWQRHRGMFHGEPSHAGDVHVNGFLSELKRRNVIRMAGLYLVGAWLITQVAATLLPVFEAPAWMMKTLVGIMAAGFIPAMMFAWAFELTPNGLKRDADIPEDQSIAPQTGRRMERLIIAVFALALVFFGVDKFVLAPKREAALVSVATQAVNEKAAQKEKAGNEKSIAVLAFTDLSPNRDQEYFSDGIAEEILNSLVRVKDLKVAGRTSSFSFKGKNEDIRSIGKALGVANVLEGSVRKQGDRVRITAQLIRTEDGFHLWSETFDGDLQDVFELQERIARAITGKLEVILQGEQKSRLVQVGTSNTEAYALYLQATAIFNRREGARFAEAIDMLNKAIALDPDYARAHSRLAALYNVNASYMGSAAYSEAMPLIELHARRATELDPSLAEPFAAMGAGLNERRRYIESHAAFSEALKRDPDDVTANFWHGVSLINTGYVREGNAAIDRALAVDPLMPNALLWRARNYIFDGDLENGERMLRLAAEGGHVFVGIGQTRLDIARGDKASAISSLTKGLAGYFTSAFPPEAAAVFSKAIYGDADAKKQSMTLINAYLATNPEYIAGVVPYVLMRSGDVGRGLKLAQDKTSNDSMVLSEMFRRNSEVKGIPEFPEFARRSGLAALWDTRGAPDNCRKNDKGDYVCE
jgi:TolB-like protein/Flp pilus assembly protein TadD